MKMHEIRAALLELATDQRTKEFHEAILKMGHKWRGETPTLEDVSGMVFSAISAVTRGEIPHSCGRAGSGGIYATYYVWPSGCTQVELYYSPCIGSYSFPRD